MEVDKAGDRLNKQQENQMDPKVEELGEAEQHDLELRKAHFMVLLDKAGIEPQEDEDTPELADRLILWWRSQPPKTRPSANVLAWSVGAGVGDLLTMLLPVEWKLVTDGDGTELALVGTTPDGEIITSFIVHSIAKRLGSEPGAFVCDFLSALIPDLAERMGLEMQNDDENPEAG